MIRTRVLEFCRLRTKPLIHGTLLHMRKGSNLRHLVLETSALPSELLMYSGKRRTRPPVQLPRHPVFKTGRGSNATASLSNCGTRWTRTTPPKRPNLQSGCRIQDDFQFPCFVEPPGIEPGSQDFQSHA